MRRFITALVLLAALAAPACARAGEGLLIKPDAELKAIAEAQAVLVGAHLGMTLHLKLAVGWATHPSDNPHALSNVAKTENGDFDQHGPVCQIAVNQSWLNSLPTGAAAEVLAHEVFHCFESQIEPDIRTPSNKSNESNWIVEGLARWVDLTLYPVNPVAEAFIGVSEYVGSSSKELFRRSYDAVGFWGHVQDLTGALWQRIPAIVKRGVGFHDQRAFAAAVGSEENQVLDTWGSSAFELARRPGRLDHHESARGHAELSARVV